MSQGSVAQQPIYSTFRNDADLGELVEMYVEEMPDRADALQSAYDAGDLDELSRLAHQLKGASGSYGFPQLTVPATRLENVAHDRAESEEIVAALDGVLGVCRRIR